MLSANRGIWQALIPLWFLLFGVFAPAGCVCGPQGQAQSSKALPCRPQHERLAVAPPLASKTIVPGTIPVSFGVTDSGDVALSMPLVVPPGRAGVEPSLAVTYSSNGGAGILGTGFSVSGASSITRCPKTMAIDGEIREVDYSSHDARCLDGRRLVLVAQNGDSIEYRTFPDSQVKVVAHIENGEASYFEAFLPSGWIVEYGKTAGSRPLARNGAPRAWLATETRDARGNSMSYGYCFAESDEGFTAEYALDELTYTGFDGQEGTRVVSFIYGSKDDVRTIYSAGMAFQNALRLDEIQTSVDGELVRRYEFAYEQGETTGRTRLNSAQECGADGACKPKNRIQYAKTRTGFERVSTTIAAPLSRLSSYMLGDFNGDGLDDLLTPDTTPSSTPDNPITEWRIAPNQGNQFAAPKVVFSQEWSFQQDPQGPLDPALLQPELGVALDYNQDGRTDVLLYDVYGNRNNHIVLLSKADGSFEDFDTGIRRPFPLGPAPKQLRSPGGSVHLADVDGDGVGDLIQCEDHGNSPELDPSQSAWILYLWRPGGFEATGMPIEPLAGFSCAVELRTVDVNRNGKIDLVLPGMIRIGGTPTVQATTYSSLERQADSTWKAWDTKLPIPPSPGRVVWADVNGDGLPDAIANGSPDGRLHTWINTDGHYAAKPADALDWGGVGSQETYFHLATPLDWDGDGRTDLLMPMSEPPELPKWYILRAAGGTNTFERLDAGIPFEPELGDAVTLADPRGPRVGDVNGDGAPDVVLFIGNELHVFQNRASNPDVLTSFSDGLNEREPEDSSFIPNVSISYGHLIDESITNGAEPKESKLYLSRSDSNNTCEYPRRCAVGSRRIVREYAANDGQGGVRRFGIRYRDGRYDRRGHGFLGFGERIVTDLDTNAGTATFYDNDTVVSVGKREIYPFTNQMYRQWRWAPALPHESKQNRVELVFADSTIDVVPTNDGQTYFTLSTKRHSRRMQGTLSAGMSLEAWVASIEANENATMLRDSTVTVTDYDVFGNVLEVDVATVGVDLTYHVSRTVKNDVEQWILGQMQTQTECSKAGVESRCRLTSRTTNEFGEVESESTSDEAFPDSKLTIEYDKRDKYGNIEHLTAHDESGHVRSATTVFDDEGVFPVKEINALLHETALDYDRRFGLLIKEIDPNQLVTEWQYDSLGRETLEKRPDGSQTTTTLSREKVGETWRYSQRIATTGGADDETIFDSQGRPIRTFSHGPTPEGQKTPRRMQVFGYDRLTGKTAKQSVLTAEGTPDDQMLFDVFEFDSIGRQILHTTPWNATIKTTYDGLVIESADLTEFPPRRTLTALDALGRPVMITDAAKGKTRYTYGPFNTLRTATDPGGAKTTWTLDAFGRPRSIDDPDRGLTVLKHDGFGDLHESTDALGRVVTFDVDELGRVETRTDKLGAQVQTTTWKWDTAPNGIGRLHSVTSPDAIQSFSYSKRGQLEGMAQTVEGGSFAARQSYDDVGRVKSIDYPQPLGVEPFGVMYEHDEHGFVIGVQEKNTNESFWTLKEVEDAGRIRKERFGNEVETTREYDKEKQTLKGISTARGSTNIQKLGYDWDSRLNLKSRSDALQLQNKTERFRYDELDRVTCAYFGAVENAAAPCVTSYSYMLNGNLWEKSDVGTYTYDPKHPHAVKHVPGETFVYDDVGNQISRPGGIFTTYTPFDLPKTITKGGKTTSFGYDGDQKRIRKTSSSSETIYFGEIFEQVTSAAGVVERRFYVFSPERPIAVVTRGGAEPGTRFLHVDHLGSVDVVTKEDGSIAERRSYDAYGARRNPEWGGPGGVASSKITKGFTGHEEDDELGLVNMRGRIFDPRLARFTTTDPVIADIWNGQTLNRYAYVNGNSLAFVDPTGFVPVDDRDVGGRWSGTEGVPIKTSGQGLNAIIDYSTFVVTHSWDETDATATEDLFESIESTNSMRFTGDMGTIGNGASGLPQETTDPESSSWRNNPYVNGIGGFAVGLLEGIVPGAALSYGLQDAFGEHDGMMRQARIGRSLGQMLGGAITAGIGLAGEAAATGFILTGVGSVVGVPVAAVSTVAVASGAANFLAGFQGLAKQLTGGGATRGPPSGSQSSGSSGWRVGDDIYKPTAKGAKPNWSTVRARYWKNRAASSDATQKYGAENVERMKRGLAPQQFNLKKGGIESMDLSHEPVPARNGGTNLVERWPQDHANVDSYRRPGY